MRTVAWLQNPAQQPLSRPDPIPHTPSTCHARRVDRLSFETYVASELAPDLLATGREAYCLCTLQVDLRCLTMTL